MAENLQFVSWSRRGAAVGTAALPAQPDGRLHVSRHFDLTTTPRGGSPVVVPADSAPVTVLGPGDVVGIDRTQVLRRSPRPDDHNLEPNYLATLELAHPDLPWMFSPELGTGEKAPPWLMLVVLPDPARTAIAPAPVGRPCPVLTVPDAAAVPDPASAWAFAHVQVRGAGDAATAVDQVTHLDAHTSVLRSRLLCPTRLHPGTAYVAVLVPTYELGRLAGLGAPVPEGTGAALWKRAAGLQLPVYDSWRFWTGPSGDFETLAKKLHRVAPDVIDALGVRSVAVEAKAALLQPSGPAPDVFSGVYDVPTAITRIGEEGAGPLSPDAAHPDAQAAPLHERLGTVVDLVAGAPAEDPLVGPPLYGQWPALAASLEDGGPAWLEQLNLDPALRAAAGVATLVVQHDQEELMADAWGQLEQVQAANHRARWASLFAHTSLGLHDRVAALDPSAALRLLAPATGRLLQDAGRTFRATLDASTVPREALGSALARTARFAVRAGGREQSTTTLVSSTLEALRTSAPGAIPARYTAPRVIDPAILDELTAEERFRPALTQGLATQPEAYLQQIRDVPHAVDRLAETLVLQPAPRDVQAPQQGTTLGDTTRVRLLPKVLKRVHALTDLATTAHTHGELQLSDHVVGEIAALRKNGVDQTISLATLSALNEVASRSALGGGTTVRGLDLSVDAAEVHVDRQQRSRSPFVLLGLPVKQARAAETVSALRSATLTDLGIPEIDVSALVSDATTADSKALRRMIDVVSVDTAPVAGPVATPELEPLDLGVAHRLVAKVEPLRAYRTMMDFAYTYGDTVVRRENDPLHPAMAAPLFPRPAIERLTSLDEEWVLGGVHRLQPNSVCLLAVNWRFVEAFLAGANHEMARELLWRGYPTDLRGTCFRRFWNGPGEDVSSMDRWGGALGSHGAGGARTDFTVLLVKGDLLRRYPNTIIAAEKGTASKAGDEVSFVSEDHRPELFRGFLGEDVSYVAIDVRAQELAVRDAANDRHCWYISLTEPHDEPRFGLDEQDGDVAGANAGRADSDAWSWQGLDDPSLPHLAPAAVRAGDSSSQAASHLFQRPFRVLLRAPDYV